MRPRCTAAALLGLGAALAASGCTFEPGDWFARLSPAVSARWSERPERSIEPGWQKLATDYQLRITRGELRIAAVELLASGAGGGSRFDPAHPPPGYGLCHNGHCHAADGRLVPYEEIEAELSGGTAAPKVTVSLAGGMHDLLAPAMHTPACEPSCQLGLMKLTKLRVQVARLQLEGEVRDGPGVRQPIGQRGFNLDLAASAETPLPPIVASIDLPADNRHPPLVTLALSVQPFAGLFDGVDWTSDPGLATAATQSSLREKLTETPLDVRMSRTDP